MTRVVLSGGAYQSRSVIAGAQRCVNLYPEKNPADSDPPVPVTHYPTPGLRLLLQSATVSGVRCLYRATNGDLYAVIGSSVLYISPDWAETVLGTIPDGTNPVSMADNGIVIVLVDGGTTGYTINLGTRVFGSFTDAAYYGADRVEYIDTFFVFNHPGTTQFYISGSLATTFDGQDIAGKTGGADNLQTIIAVQGQLWLLGVLTTEVWTNSGAADFTFERQSGGFIEHGCVAKYSAAKQDVSVFWLSQDREGVGIVVKGNGYSAGRISTHAIEAAIQSYARRDDAIGYCFQQQGHAFYVLTFPTADKTWAFELQTGQWHELVSTDLNGGSHRHRANCAAFAYGVNVVGDWQNGRLYALDPAIYTENGLPIVRIRTFPHMVDDGRRLSYDRFIADIEVGALGSQQTQGGFSIGFSADFQVTVEPYGEPTIALRISDNRGNSFGNPIVQSLGKTGEYLTSPQWRRLGLARDRVFELSWSIPARTALNGAFVDVRKHAS